jgi:hypothetical protein
VREDIGKTHSCAHGHGPEFETNEPMPAFSDATMRERDRSAVMGEHRDRNLSHERKVRTGEPAEPC